MPAATPKTLSPTYLEDQLPDQLPQIFQQVQLTLANHRKNIVALRKIQQTCAAITSTSKDGKSLKLLGERAFNEQMIGMVHRVLGIKKGVAQADRVVKFIASYVQYCTEQEDAAARASEGVEEDDEVEDTPSTRFIAKLLQHLLAGFGAKDKNVRFRCTLLTVSLISGLGEMDDNLYVSLRSSLLERARDKESSIRVQAAFGIAKLHSGEDEADLEEDEESLFQVLVDLLRYDPAAEVRRAALYNLPLTPTTLPLILARTRDIDPLLRRTVYQTSLSVAVLPDPRVLSIAQREEIVRNGLGDRDELVRKAAAGMLAGWVDGCDGDLLQFLTRFDVVSSQVAEDALVSVFVTSPHVFDAVEFDDAFWNELTPERAFLARVFVDHCKTSKNDARLENVLPVVTALAFRIQDEYNKLVLAVNDPSPSPTIENLIAERAFIVGELLKLAVNLDYADEIGRRKMFQLAREMISQAHLPESLIPACLDVLSMISEGERDLIRVIVDVVTELRDGFDDDDEEMDDPLMDSQASSIGDTPAPRRIAPPRPEMLNEQERMKAALIDLRCLAICISLLERVNSTLQDNSVFHGLLPDLIIPAVRNKEEPALRDQGLVCLGLCCMIDIKMATNSFGLFIQQLQAADDELKLKVVQVLFDLLMVHDFATLLKKTMPVDKIVELLRHTLNQDSPQVQAVACEGVAKLMLAGMVSDELLLQTLVLLYLSPDTVDNQPLRQSLTYFLPVYCYSSTDNQRRMQSIFIETFEILGKLSEDLEEDQEMVSLATAGLMMVDWTDPSKAVERDGARNDVLTHIDLGVDICKAILEEDSKETRKTLTSFLNKLYLPEAEAADEWKLKSLMLVVVGIRDRRPLQDAASRNALARFEASLNKKYPELLEGSNEDGFQAMDEVRELCDMIAAVRPFDDNASESGKSVRKPAAGKRKQSVTPAPSEIESVEAESSDESESDEAVAPPVRKGKKMQVVVEESSEEEEEDEDVESILGSESD